MQYQTILLVALCAIVAYAKKNVRFGVSNSLFKETVNHRELRSLVHDVSRTRTINLPSDRPVAAVGELIEFELFDDQIALGQTTDVNIRSEDDMTWIGSLRISTGNAAKDLLRDDGLFALTCVQKACSANLQIFSTKKKYRIAPANTVLTPDGHGLYVLSEVYLPPEKRTGVNMTAVMMAETKKQNEMLAMKKEINLDAGVPTARPTAAPTTKPDTDQILDLLVFYTPEARDKIYGRR
jgi:hypothetical protein